MSQVLTREQILHTPTLVREHVDVPEWEGSVWVRELKGFERDRLDEMIWRLNQQLNFKNVRAQVAIWTVQDAEGKPLFTQKDLDGLTEQSGRVLDRIYEVVQRLSGIGKDATQDAVKNSASDPSDDSG